MNQSALQAAMQHVKLYDSTRYLSTLLCRQDLQSALFALYAFNIEVSRVRDLVSEPIPGEIRLQWWRDILEHGERDGTGAPFADALLTVKYDFDLPFSVFDSVISAHSFDLYNDPMPSLNDLEGYCGETSSLLFRLAGMIAIRSDMAEYSDLCGHAGVAYRMMELLCNFGLHSSRQQLYFPYDQLQDTGLTLDTLWQEKGNGALVHLFHQIIDVADVHAQKATDLLMGADKDIRSVFLPLAIVRPTLSKLRKLRGEDVLKSSSQISQLKRQWILWRASVRI